MNGDTKTIISKLNIQSLKLYFVEPTDNFDLTSLQFGQIKTIKDALPKVHFDNNSATNLAQNWGIHNVQTSSSEKSFLIFNDVFIQNAETIFLEGPKIMINTVREIPSKNSLKSPFLTVPEINLLIFKISPSFNQNGNITVLSKSDEIAMTSSSGQTVATVQLVNSKETRLYMNDERNANKNKILVKKY